MISTLQLIEKLQLSTTVISQNLAWKSDMNIFNHFGKSYQQVD
jgi:hypothetical protein